MIAWILIALFVIIGALCLISLADSVVRARNAWRQIKRDMDNEFSDSTFVLETDLVAFHGMQPLHHRAKAPTPTAHNDETNVAAA